MGRFSIKMKLVALIAGAVVAVAVLLALSLSSKYDAMIDGRVDKLRSVIQTAATLATQYDAQVKAGKLSQDQAMAAWKEDAMAMKFDDGVGYLFAYDLQATAVVQGGNPSMIGKNFIDLKDPYGNYPIRSLLDVAKNKGEGRFDYWWPKPGSDEPLKKVSYGALLPEWKLAVGTGVYVDDVQAQFWEDATALMISAAVILAALGAFAFLISRDITVSIGHVVSSVKAIAAGDAKGSVPGTGRADEVGAIAKGLDALRGVVREAFQLKQIVEDQPAKVMLCDPKTLEVTYLNKAAKSLLQSMEHDIGTKADAVIGQPVTRFAKDDTLSARRLSDPKSLPIKGLFEVGRFVIENTVIPVYDVDGSYLGPMLSWNDVTKTVQMAKTFEEKVKEVASGVSASATELERLSEALQQTAHDVGERSSSVAAAAEQAGVNVQTVASASEELTASIGEIGRNVERSTQLTG